MSLIKAEREGVHYLVWASAVGVSDQHVLQQYRDTMNRIAASIAFVPSTVDPLTWDVAHVVQTVGPATGFSVWHPQGFTVDIDHLEATLSVASGESNDRYSSGQLSIVIRPEAVHRADLWDAATPLPYRLLGHEARIVHEATTASGHRTDYAIAVGAGTWQVSVTTPLLETASDTSWLYDQTAWFILKNAAVFYDHPQASGSDYPGPP